MPALINGPTLGLKGRYRFHVLHPDTGKPILGRDGVPIYRDASGFVRRAGIWHPNLITNRGMDQIADEGFTGTGGVRNSLKVGTGNATPDVTDATLAAYVGNVTSPNGANDGVYVYELDGTTYRFTATRHVIYTASGSVALAEFGFDHEAGDYASIRELLRDEVGDPTTVSLEAGQQLAVEHDAIMEVAQSTPVSFDIVEKNLAGTTVDTQSYTGTLHAVMMATSSFWMSYLTPNMLALHSSVDTLLFCGGLDGTFVPGLGNVVDFVSPYAWGSTPLHDAYVAGSHERLHTLRLPAEDVLSGEAGIKMILLGYEYGSDLRYGVALFLDDPQAIPKAANKRLDLRFRISWARA